MPKIIVTSRYLKSGSKKNLANYLGCTQQTYSRYETGALEPSLVIMEKLAIILMGAFGTPDSVFAKILHFAFFMFGPSTAGTIYSFGFTLVSGVILNLFFGVFCSRLMLSSLSKFKALRNPVLYGGKKNA